MSSQLRRQATRDSAARSRPQLDLDWGNVVEDELEQVLDAHPSVYESAAVAVRPEGEGAERLVVYAVLTGEADREALPTELGRLLKTRLNPLFKIYDVRFVGALPRTASNKLMRRKLRAAWAATATPAPES